MHCNNFCFLHAHTHAHIHTHVRMYYRPPHLIWAGTPGLACLTSPSVTCNSATYSTDSNWSETRQRKYLVAIAVLTFLGRRGLDKRFHNFLWELTAGVKREILLPLLSFEGLCVLSSWQRVFVVTLKCRAPRSQGFAKCSLTSSLTGLLINTRHMHARSNYCASVC